MEKRALIAVVLMFAVLLIYNALFLPKRRQVSPPEVTQEEETLAEPGGEGREAPSDTAEVVGIEIPTGAAEFRRTVVRTPLYTAELDSRGGVLSSLKLSQYLSSQNQPVELVPQTDSLPLGIALLTTRGDRIDLSGAAFAVSSESLRVERGVERDLVFELTTDQGLTVIKALGFSGDTYTISTDIRVSGPGSEQIRAVEFGWQSGLKTTEANRADDLRNFASLTLTGERLVKLDLRKVRRQGTTAIGDVAWAGVKTKYFFAAVVPLGGAQAVANSFMGGEESIGVALETDLRGPAPQQYLVYAGPLDYQRLKRVGYRLDKAVDFGWKWIRPLSRLIFAFMLVCHRAIPNYGWVIILLSTLTKVLFYPLTQKSFKSMREMQKLQPEMQALREKYKNDAQRLNKAVMELYRERGVNPLGGCLPLLLQMPVFISLFNVLSKTIELRRAAFGLWIKDLSAPDVVAHLPFSLPFIGNNLSVLPILMGVAMFVQQKMSTTDPKQAAMTYMLPIVFTVMFFRFPSGLVLYWLVNNVLTIGHQYLMTRGDKPQQASTTGG